MDSNPDFLLTAEVRWFFEENLPHQVQQWFEELAGDDPPEERTDHYLVYPTTTNCGIKFREERLEVKTFVKKLHSISLLPSLKGNIELWEKLGLSKVKTDNLDMDQELHFMHVKKKRWRCMWQWSFDNLYRASVDKSVMAGCQLELSSIHINDRTFWSLCLELFYNTDNAVMILENTISLVGQFPALMELEKQHAFKNGWEASYPQLLHGLLQESK